MAVCLIASLYSQAFVIPDDITTDSIHDCKSMTWLFHEENMNLYVFADLHWPISQPNLHLGGRHL
jgi:hypothetical protein